MKQRKDWIISCDVCKATEGLENELCDVGKVTEGLERLGETVRKEKCEEYRRENEWRRE